MDDLVLRALVVAIIACVAALAAFISRRGRASARRTFESSGIGPGLHLFTSASCASCDRARSTLVASGHPFTEHTYEQSEAVLRRNRIERVPAIVHVPEGPSAGWLAEGVPSIRSLERWLGP